MRVEVRDQSEAVIGELFLPVTGKHDADELLYLGERGVFYRIDTPDGFYYQLRSSLKSIESLTEFTPAETAP